jgi:hypothetical protein
MKNLHLIPTNKPSKLYKVNNNLYFEEYPDKTVNAGNQHIYITSDEEIKEGDWCYGLFAQKPFILSDFENVKINFPEYKSEYKKIILTTDQDLDGVQAIDDEFLEWFVKNPSCEEVEVVDNLKYFNVDELRERHLKGLPHLYSEKIGYKIIIPKEEPKQELPKLGTKEFNDLASAYFGGKPKQETLEEAAERISKEHYVDQSDYWAIGVDSFKRGAKWQQERMYSEVIEFAEWIRNNPYVWKYPDKLSDTRTTEELFEQFKKK